MSKFITIHLAGSGEEIIVSIAKIVRIDRYGSGTMIYLATNDPNIAHARESYEEVKVKVYEARGLK